MSMCDQETLHWIDKRLRQASGKEDVLFGGFSVLLFGDFAQLPPVQGKPLFLKSDNPGYLTYLAFKKVVVLDQAQRQTGNAQKKFRAALLRLQDGCITEEDWKLWCSRDPEELGWNPEEWKRATRLYSTNILVDDYNSKKLEQLEAPTAPIFAENNCSKAKRADSNKAHGLRQRVDLAKGAYVMLTSNLWPEAGLVNGTKGVVREILYPEGATPTALPSAVMVEFEGYSGPSFSSDGVGLTVVPIVPRTMQWEDGAKKCSRRQLPLRLAWALTIHKAQGLTLDKAVIDISKKEMVAGLTFVAFSRVRKLQDMIIKSYDFERYARISNGKILKDRLQEQKRLRVLERETLA